MGGGQVSNKAGEMSQGENSHCPCRGPVPIRDNSQPPVTPVPQWPTPGLRGLCIPVQTHTQTTIYTSYNKSKRKISATLGVKAQ